MQLRDDFPHIIHPGKWGFFGGHLEPGESPDAGVKRELMEELAYVPPKLDLFEKQVDTYKIRYFYHGELSVPVDQLSLNEGQDIALCSPEEVIAGERYSERIGEVRQLVNYPHQQALLSFMRSGLTHMEF